MDERPARRGRPAERIGRAAALVALLLVAAACGARWDEEQAAEVASRRAGTATTSIVRGGTARAAATGGSRAGQPAGPATADGDPATGEASGADVGAAGAPGAATGPGAPAPGGALPCAAPADAPGVTDDTIRVGSISSLSGPVPGLGASAAAAARSYVARLNAEGGVCGRRVELREADDGTDNGRYRALVRDLGEDVLGIAGGFALGDVGGIDVVAELALPIVNVPSADAVTELPTMFDINPPYDRTDVIIGKYRYLHDDRGVRKAAVAYQAVDQSRAEARLQQQLMEAAGIEVVQVQELPVATLSYDSAARRVANSGADYLFFIGDPTANASMARAVRDTGHELRVAEYFTFAYGTDFIERAGPDAAEGAMSWIRTLPNEEAGSNREVAAFVDWMERVAPGDVRDVFAADSWAGAKAFFDALAALPGPISRDALVAQLAGVGTYDAGGMLGPIRLGAERTDGCFVAMQVQSGRWRRLVPADGFLC